jgi:hypothetical protein
MVRGVQVQSERFWSAVPTRSKVELLVVVSQFILWQVFFFILAIVMQIVEYAIVSMSLYICAL